MPFNSRLFFLVALLFMMMACARTGVIRHWPQSTGTSFVELDENTDPRFVNYSRRRNIGLLKIVGNEAWLNGRRLSSPATLNSDDHVRTGYLTGAQITFNRGRQYSNCQIGILNFYRGTLYGETSDCTHELDTSLGGIRTGLGNTLYNVKITPDQVRVSVGNGELQVWLKNNPSAVLTIGGNQEAVLTRQIIIGPRDLGPSLFAERTRWRRKFDFEAADKKTEFCQNYAQEATEQHRRNRKDDCGFRDPRWHSDYDRHFDWCMSLDSNYRSIAERENEARAEMLNRCARAFVSVPSVTGKDLQQAKSLLNRYDLKLGQTNYLNRGTDYTVVRQAPRAGTRVNRGSTVDLDLKGESRPPVAYVTVPSLIGKDLRSAQAILARYSLKPGRINYLNQGSNYKVARQTPRAGTQVQKGSAIDLDLKGETGPIIY
ncbi:MAG: PASTA domain-containing protein [Gammaproteobacteria bacterium]